MSILRKRKDTQRRSRVLSIRMGTDWSFSQTKAAGCPRRGVLGGMQTSDAPAAN